MPNAANPTTHNRRQFLTIGGSLLIGFPLLGGCLTSDTDESPQVKLPGSLRRTSEVDAWLEVLEDGRVRVFSGKVELGQGIRIAIKQVAAEELYMDLDQVEVVLAETGRTPNEGYTSGSGSIQSSAIAVRHAAAYAREQLLHMAATRLQLPVAELTISKGNILTPEGSSLSFAEVLEGQQITGAIQLPVPLKPTSDYQYVGKSIRRGDLMAMVMGKGMFVQDLRFPGMLYGKVLRPKNYQSSLLSFDQKAFEAAAPSVLQTIVDGSFIGVICKSSYEATTAIRVLEEFTEWSEPDFLPVQKELPSFFKQSAEAPTIAKERGVISKLGSNALTASYFKPYHMHASLGPACSVAMYDGQVLHVWTNSQGIYPLREALKSMLGMTSEQIHIISVPGPGVFGHTSSDDAAADAAIMAIAHPQKHIMLEWSREDDMRWEPYGSAMIVALEADLGESGQIQQWTTDVWTDSQSTRPNKDAGSLLTARYLADAKPMQGRGYLNGGHRNADPYYDIPNLRVQAHFFDGPLRVSSLRSLAAYGNAFAIESFMDELADRAGKDPVAFRLTHLTDPRAKAVLERVQDMCKDTPVDSGEGIGFAFCRYKNYAAYCAIAAKIKVEEQTGNIRLLKMWTAVDVGEVINPDGLRNQTEGGLLQAASWTLAEEVRFDEVGIQSSNFGSYPMLRYSDMPDIEVAILDRPDEPAMGGGEASVPPVGAAIANAVFRASGQRLYTLPLKIKGENG
ncbi:MAG: molybdopterin cofactor-binding domain-containing protein [Bacteroidota bacterium]